jgi:hypothetical protein
VFKLYFGVVVVVVVVFGFSSNFVKFLILNKKKVLLIVKIE